MKGPNKLTLTLTSLCVLLALCVLCGCEDSTKGKAEHDDSGEGAYTSLSQIEDKRTGVTTGSIQAIQAEERLPHATFFYFSNTADMLNALRSNKVDAFADSDLLLGFVMGESPDITFIDEPLAEGMDVSGIGNTMLITLLSIVFGTLLGFAGYILCRGGNLVANKLAGVLIWLINGMPVVVLLMILFYVVFGNTDLSGIIVSVVAFSLIFGSAMFAMLSSGVKAVDKGQTEAAYALGYADRKAFFLIILPQAAIHFMPEYRGQVVSLLKATAVVGYVAVQDLTKMGDIVRSRTYEAFFPLIAITVIYFVLAAILIRVIDRLTRHIDPKSRSPKQILKGVVTHE